jgi:hypothetical protein
MWHHFASPQEYACISATVDSLATEAGRDPTSIGRASSLSISEGWDEVRRTIEAYAAAGVSHLVCGWPSEGHERVGEFAEEVMGEYR